VTLKNFRTRDDYRQDENKKSGSRLRLQGRGQSLTRGAGRPPCRKPNAIQAAAAEAVPTRLLQLTRVHDWNTIWTKLEKGMLHT